MEISIKDGSKLELENGATILDVAKKISEGLARNAIAGKLNGALAQLSAAVKEGDCVEIVTLKDTEGMNILRHSTAHVMALAVMRLLPDTKIAIGPAIEDGFYYDFDFSAPVKSDFLPKIENEMQNIIKSGTRFEFKEVTRAEAQQIFKELKQEYKLELLADIPEGEKITVYTLGELVDLCRGPHLEDISIIKAFKLLSVTGAYWRGDENNKMLTRIYGTCFPKRSELDEYLEMREQAKLRDHNKIGRELGFFTTDELVGQGLPLLMPYGARVVQVLQRFVEDEEQKRGYMLTKTPFMAKSDLFKVSGHWEHYKDSMFILGDEQKDKEVFALRPMTCPFQFIVYKNGLKSYKDLPARYNETSTLFRKEDSGEMHGLIRVRQMTLAEGHIILAQEQLEDEFARVMDLLHYVLEKLGIKEDIIYYRFSKWDPQNLKNKYINDPEKWEYSQNILRKIMQDLNIPYVEAEGEAAFYGPKIDFQVKNVWGKEDTLCTIQIDFAMAERFDMSYVDSDGEKKRPWIIHRSYSTYERLFAFLIEKFGGALPLWYSPVQVKVLSITDRTADYANKLCEALTLQGIRAEADNRNEKIGYKIREAQMMKVPYMAILGDEELEKNTVAVRHRKEGDIGSMKVDEFVDLIVKENRDKIVK